MTNIVILSGGMDSTAVLAMAVRSFDGVRAVSFDYGQRHRRELEAAKDITALLGVPHQVLDLKGLLSGSALLSPDVAVPEGHYTAETMAATVVNGRNLLFASAAIALCAPGDHLWFGVHAGDHAVYPDCRPEFWGRLAALTLDAYGVTLRTPFLLATKAEIVEAGASSGAPFHLSWSCYKGGERHCGRCGTCVERAEAFALAEVNDPTEYVDPTYWRSATA